MKSQVFLSPLGTRTHGRGHWEAEEQNPLHLKVKFLPLKSPPALGMHPRIWSGRRDSEAGARSHPPSMTRSVNSGWSF